MYEKPRDRGVKAGSGSSRNQFLKHYSPTGRYSPTRMFLHVALTTQSTS